MTSHWADNVKSAVGNDGGFGMPVRVWGVALRLSDSKNREARATAVVTATVVQSPSLFTNPRFFLSIAQGEGPRRRGSILAHRLMLEKAHGGFYLGENLLWNTAQSSTQMTQ